MDGQIREEFAQKLIHWVRDQAVAECDRELSADAHSPVARRWRAAVAGGSSDGLAEAIPDCVDSAVFSLLDALDQGAIRLAYITDSGETVELGDPATGELGGWFMGSPGWRHAYSRERFHDDFSDLAE